MIQSSSPRAPRRTSTGRQMCKELGFLSRYGSPAQSSSQTIQINARFVAKEQPYMNVSRTTHARGSGACPCATSVDTNLSFKPVAHARLVLNDHEHIYVRSETNQSHGGYITLY